MSKQRMTILRICAETGADMRTVKKWLEGQEVAPVTEYALREACRKLRISQPQRPEPAQCSM